MKRGDVLIAAIPNLDGSPPKNRPVLVIQADFYNQRITNVIVAQITSNLARRQDAAHCFIDVQTADGQKSGLRADSLASCLNILMIEPTQVRGKIGELSVSLMAQVDECLKKSLGIA